MTDPAKPDGDQLAATRLASQKQIVAAASAGVDLLSNKELPVPLGIAINGRLGMLLELLQLVAEGELVVINQPTPDQIAEARRLAADQSTE